MKKKAVFLIAKIIETRSPINLKYLLVEELKLAKLVSNEKKIVKRFPKITGLQGLSFVQVWSRSCYFKEKYTLFVTTSVKGSLNSMKTALADREFQRFPHITRS